MDNLKYLEHVVELGKVQAATTPEEMSGAFDAFNGFLGLYYDLAKMELQKAGAAVVIEEKDLTGEKLVQTVSAMLAQPGKLAEMGKNARSLSVDDSLDRITAALLKLVKTP